MKGAIYKLTTVLFLISGMVCASDREVSSRSMKFAPCEKIYVQPSQIEITDEGIFFQMNDEWVATAAIQSDGSGLFVNSVDSEWSWRWTCPKCDYENSPFSRSCANCGYKPRH